MLSRLQAHGGAAHPLHRIVEWGIPETGIVIGREGEGHKILGMGKTEFIQVIEVFCRLHFFPEEGHPGEKDPIPAVSGNEGLEIEQAGGGSDDHMPVSGERGGPLVEFHFRKAVIPGETIVGEGSVFF